jgi:ribose 5-phosphate isomerase B
MKIVLAADHRGFALKELIKTQLTQQYQVVDCGATEHIPDDDYVDYGLLAVNQLGAEDKAILFCGSGHGMDITANRYSHIRAILGFNLDVIRQGREHEDANVLVIPADWIKIEEINQYVNAFINTPFSGEDRHLRRLHKLSSLTTNH